MSELLTVRADQPAYFCSDAHLGALHGHESQQQLQNLNKLLTLVEQDAKTLFIVGDLFDFWFEWKFVIPKRYFSTLHRLRNLTDRGILVHLLAGNHDFRLEGFLESEIGLQVHHQPLAVQIADQRLFVYHGDGVLKRDKGYRLLKRVLRNKAAQRAFSWLHPDWGMALARGTSITSRTVIKENPADDQEYLAFAQSKFSAGFDGVIMGHTHRPVEFHDGAKTYINLGDWMKHYTYAVHRGQALSLHRL